MRRFRMFAGLLVALYGAFWIFMLVGFGTMMDPDIAGAAWGAAIWRFVISDPSFPLGVVALIAGGWLMFHEPKQTTPATLDDLHRVEGKAELIRGGITQLAPSGDAPSEAAFEIAVSLREHARRTGVGVAFPDGIGYAQLPALPSGRQSFSPDASYYDGPRPRNRMRFIDGAPTFAVEVRSEHDYGDAAEAEMAAKRADYFQAGTLVVWDVDPIARIVAVYRADQPNQPLVRRRGEMADAEPAVPGWRLAVDDLFPL